MIDKLITAKEILKAADHYLNCGDAQRAAELLQEAERLAVEIAMAQAERNPSRG